MKEAKYSCVRTSKMIYQASISWGHNREDECGVFKAPKEKQNFS